MDRQLVDKGVDADERDVPDDVGGDERSPRKSTRRWWIAGGAAAAVLAAGAVAVAVSGDGGDRDAPADAGPSASSLPRADPPAPDLDWRLVVGDVPASYALQWINAPELQDGGFQDFGVAQRVQLLAAADADFEDGPWIATTVQLLDRFERRSFDPMQYVDPSQATSTRVGAYEAVFYDDPFAGTSTLLFGPVDDGYAVSISFGGIDRATVSRVAAEMTIDDPDDTVAPRAVLGPAAAELGLELLADYEESTWGFGGGAGFSALIGGSPAATSIIYGDDLGGLTLANQPLVGGLDPLVVGAFVLTDDKAVTVHGLPAVVGEISAFGFDNATVVWVEGGRSIVLTGSFEPDELVEIAESVREAGRDEYDELLAEVQEQNPDLPNGSPEQTWLLGAGDLEDSTTWSVEGEIRDGESGAATLLLCWAAMTSDSSGSSCGDVVEVKAPALVDGPDVGDQVFHPTLIAMIDIGQEGVVLRFTTDDGDVIDAPVRVVRDDWPVRVVAIAVERPGRAELIAADGTVLADREFSEEDVDGGDFPAGPVPANTTAAG